MDANACKVQGWFRLEIKGRSWTTIARAMAFKGWSLNQSADSSRWRSKINGVEKRSAPAAFAGKRTISRPAPGPLGDELNSADFEIAPLMIISSWRISSYPSRQIMMVVAFSVVFIVGLAMLHYLL
ncbi:MAG: hypothetical protein HYV35_00795 [Lentisphaerae bacterium]|nr:hypothetical protein [Lentisphaerota bacterium]